MGEGKQRRQQSDSTSMGGGKIIFYCSAEGVTHRIPFRGVRGHAPPGKFGFSTLQKRNFPHFERQIMGLRVGFGGPLDVFIFLPKFFVNFVCQG